MKKSSIDQVVGVSDDERTAILKRYAEIVFNGQKNMPRLFEKSRSKTGDELQILALANKATNAMRRKCGLENFDVPPDNVHIIQKKFWDNPYTALIFLPQAQNIILEETSRNIRFAERAFYAMTLFKSYGALQKLTDTGEIAEYRMGLRTKPRSRAKMSSLGPHGYFEDVNDAVVAELAKRFIVSEMENPLFKKDLDETREIQKAAKKIGEFVFLDQEVYDIHYLAATKEFDREIFPYRAERAALKKICTDGRFSEQFGDDTEKMEEAVFQVFVSAMFTGHMFEFARMIKKAGKITFRALATP